MAGIARQHPGAIERLALRLHPRRVTLLTLGLGSFLVGTAPLVGVAHGQLELARWHTAVFASCVPVVLWAIGLAVLASFYHPTEGLVAARRGLLRRYAALTVWAFAVAPVFVLATAAVA